MRERTVFLQVCVNCLFWNWGKCGGGADKHLAQSLVSGLHAADAHGNR